MHRNINLVQTIKGHSRKPCSRVFHCLHNSSLMVRRACPAELYLTICQWLQRVVTAGHVKSRLSFSGMRLSIRPGDSFGGGRVGSLQPGVRVGGATQAETRKIPRNPTGQRTPGVKTQGGDLCCC